MDLGTPKKILTKDRIDVALLDAKMNIFEQNQKKKRRNRKSQYK
jgi:hypothetical protein